ncbi:hypothetical protein BDA99DRAFT_232813 [Phascolomyces articulosus]|uniref:Uncharacterized protein n=1 Tax=Phascolomyces articulosus TaxID=60185 RepID=A0AAD5JZK2_9FUNG|nr:hypothetical protein BDA99DRAFT_232813 [Phascolomyces articulosus]
MSKIILWNTRVSTLLLSTHAKTTPRLNYNIITTITIIHNNDEEKDNEASLLTPYYYTLYIFFSFTCMIHYTVVFQFNLAFLFLKKIVHL